MERGLLLLLHFEFRKRLFCSKYPPARTTQTRSMSEARWDAVKASDKAREDTQETQMEMRRFSAGRADRARKRDSTCSLGDPGCKCSASLFSSDLDSSSDSDSVSVFVLDGAGLQLCSESSDDASEATLPEAFLFLAFFLSLGTLALSDPITAAQENVTCQELASAELRCKHGYRSFRCVHTRHTAADKHLAHLRCEQGQEKETF